METRPPPQGIGQKCTPDHRIAHQGRDGGSPEAEHKNDGGGTAVKRFQDLAHLDDRVHPDSLGEQNRRGADHHHGGDQAQTQDPRITLPAPLLPVASPPAPLLNEIGLIKGPDDRKIGGDEGGDQWDGAFRKAGNQTADDRRRIRFHDEQGEKEGEQHEADQPQHQPFQKSIKVFQKQRAHRQQRKEDRPQGGGGAGQRPEGDPGSNRIARLKRSGDQEGAHPDQHRHRRPPLPPDQGEQRMVGSHAEPCAHLGEDHHENRCHDHDP